MTVANVIRGLAILFLLLAGYQAFTWFESFKSGATSPAIYALRIAAPLVMSIAMQILTRNMTKNIGVRG